jgi:hypothetical protein
VPKRNSVSSFTRTLFSDEVTSYYENVFAAILRTCEMKSRLEGYYEAIMICVLVALKAPAHELRCRFVNAVAVFWCFECADLENEVKRNLPKENNDRR